MNILDTKISGAERELLMRLIGKQLHKIRHDEYFAVDSIYRGLGVFVGDEAYEIGCALQCVDYFGGDEEISVLGVHPISPETSTSHLVGVKQVDETIERTIEDVILYEDTHILLEDGVETDRHLFTLAIQFVFSGTSVLFRMHSPISEMISVTFGRGAASALPRPECLVDEPEDPRYVYRAEQTVISLHGEQEQKPRT